MFDNLFGKPNDTQLAKINNFTPQAVTADEVFVITLRASDNLISRSVRVWHSNFLNQIATKLIGKPLMLNHDWDDVRSSVGTVFDSLLVKTDSCDADIYDQPGKTQRNLRILQKQGYQAVYCQCFISADSVDLLNALSKGTIKNCSTGGGLSKIKLMCPNCSEEKGREVCFDEVDKNGDYVCPHEIPNPYTELYEHEDRLSIADYLILDGIFDGMELSLANIGNLPAARLVY